MLGCSWIFFPNVSGLTLQQQSYKYISPCKVCVRHERQKWTLNKICSLRGLEEMQVRDKPRKWLVPSWTVRCISRCFLCVFSRLSIIPQIRASLIEWPAILQCSAAEKPSKFFSMLRGACQNVVSVVFFIVTLIFYWIFSYLLSKVSHSLSVFFFPVICLKSWIHVQILHIFKN